MNKYTTQETRCASMLHQAAKALVKQYAKPYDHRAGTIALLVEAIVQAGGAGLLKLEEK
jgi:flavoprotein